MRVIAQVQISDREKVDSRMPRQTFESMVYSDLSISFAKKLGELYGLTSKEEALMDCFTRYQMEAIVLSMNSFQELLEVLMLYGVPREVIKRVTNNMMTKL